MRPRVASDTCSGMVMPTGPELKYAVSFGCAVHGKRERAAHVAPVLGVARWLHRPLPTLTVPHRSILRRGCAHQDSLDPSVKRRSPTGALARRALGATPSKCASKRWSLLKSGLTRGGSACCEAKAAKAAQRRHAACRNGATRLRTGRPKKGGYQWPLRLRRPTCRLGRNEEDLRPRRGL